VTPSIGESGPTPSLFFLEHAVRAWSDHIRQPAVILVRDGDDDLTLPTLVQVAHRDRTLERTDFYRDEQPVHELNGEIDHSVSQEAINRAA
jgi:hypothetical protein